ncbi:MAG TPA: hypothetical protein DD381_05630 [Lentisphaeria bacterium]|nr:MAG: hypothetical protein A2X47_08470 [Lentisphaerae bacterium GWF2_38_69]HBM15807.1 hypothetical protein [Lentisphaeria bacterium]
MNTENEQNHEGLHICQIMDSHNLTAKDLVSASAEQLTFKMVNRACKGRLLTRNTQSKILNALNKASGKKYSLEDIFT